MVDDHKELNLQNVKQQKKRECYTLKAIHRTLREKDNVGTFPSLFPRQLYFLSSDARFSLRWKGNQTFPYLFSSSNTNLEEKGRVGVREQCRKGKI